MHPASFLSIGSRPEAKKGKGIWFGFDLLHPASIPSTLDHVSVENHDLGVGLGFEGKLQKNKMEEEVGNGKKKMRGRQFPPLATSRESSDEQVWMAKRKGVGGGTVVNRLGRGALY